MRQFDGELVGFVVFLQDECPSFVEEYQFLQIGKFNCILFRLIQLRPVNMQLMVFLQCNPNNRIRRRWTEITSENRSIRIARDNQLRRRRFADVHTGDIAVALVADSHFAFSFTIVEENLPRRTCSTDTAATRTAMMPARRDDGLREMIVAILTACDIGVVDPWWSSNPHMITIGIRFTNWRNREWGYSDLCRTRWVNVTYFQSRRIVWQSLHVLRWFSWSTALDPTLCPQWTHTTFPLRSSETNRLDQRWAVR